LELLAAHPLVRRVTPHLEGDVSAVGGAVRDALLGRPAGAELDLVVEGEARPVAERLGRELGGLVVTHPRFGTASVELPHGARVDVVGARRETYARPGALPDVRPGTLADDLARRDFTINAMALRLSGDGAGTLVDAHGGVADADAGLVRALRPDAFREDPSRLVRAARYAARLGFMLAPDTATAARDVAPGLDPGSSRVADELARLAGEPTAASAVALLGSLGVPWLAGPRDAGLRERLAAIDAALARPGAPELPVWPLRLGEALEPDTLARSALPGWARALGAELRDGAALAERLGPGAAPSEVDRLLRAAPPAAAVGALARGAEAVADWWADGRDREPEVRGADLVRAGVPPGPAIGRALAEVRAALLDGRVGGRDEQLALALRAAREPR
jgi:tRNA nucleotidyltransferase (CCA-adding enzyme)